jgi:hypothetical protein
MYYNGSNAFANLRQGLVGAWCPSLPNGGGGNMLPDVSGFNNHGSLVNMSADDWVSSQYGRALDFVSSTNESVQVASTANQLTVPSTAVTLAAWARPTSAGTAAGREICSKFHGSAAPYVSYGLQYHNLSVNSRFSFAVGTPSGGDGGYHLLETVSASALNQWYHVCGTYDGITIRIFLNGVQANTLSLTSSMVFTTQPFSIGRWLGNSSTNEAFIGQIDDVRIYSRVLTEPEIKLLASRPGIGLRQESHRNTFYQFPSGARRRRILTGMP